ncbi:MAG: MauE/DoxX family redox-associated membrane protein [Pseudomonadota bacterium]
MKAICLIPRVALGALFIFAAHDKLLDPTAFAHAVANYQVLSLPTANLIAHVLPWIEALCGALLLLGVAVPGASLVTSGLLVVFGAMVAQAMWRGLDIACGCFSLAAERIGYPVLLRNLALLAVSLWVFFRSLKAGAAKGRRLIP